MRVALPIAVSFAALLLAACMTPVDVVVDGHHDFSSYRTWDWLPDSRPSVEPRDIHSLTHDWQVARRVELDLQEKGFERSSHAPDFFVSYHLALRPRKLLVTEARAAHQLSSHHASPSYVIHGSNQKIVKTMDVALWLSVADTHGREIWGGSLRRMGDAHPYSVGDAVETLCGYLPSRQRPELPAPQ